MYASPGLECYLCATGRSGHVDVEGMTQLRDVSPAAPATLRVDLGRRTKTIVLGTWGSRSRWRRRACR
jgi:hypothetical protein